MISRGVAGEGGAFVEDHGAGLVHPVAQHVGERVIALAEIVVQIFLLDGTGAAESGFVAFIAVVDIDDVALLGEFDTFHLRRFPKQPEQDADAARRAVVKAVAAALLGHIFDIEIGRPAESGDGLIEQGASFLRGFVLGSAGGWCLGAGRAEQEQQCNEQFIHLRR